MDLKQKAQEFVEIAKACPENLREICFRLLLENYLAGKPRAAMNCPTPIPLRKGCRR